MMLLLNVFVPENTLLLLCTCSKVVLFSNDDITKFLKLASLLSALDNSCNVFKVSGA